MSDDRGSNTLLAFLLGGIAGAAVALLYAPRSGRETREMLGEKLREGAERGKELGNQARAAGAGAVLGMPQSPSPAKWQPKRPMP